MDTKNLKGSISVSDFADGLLAQKRFETFGALWEDYVDCSRCKYEDECKALCAQYSSKGVDLYCGEVIDYLLGDLDLDKINPEEQNYA